jgi:pimeloyl-ACP methyl ester carboxylesterase
MNTIPHTQATQATLAPALNANVHALGEGARRFVLYAASPINHLGGQVDAPHGGKNEPRHASTSDASGQPVDTPVPSSVELPAAVLLIHSINAAASAAEVRPLFEVLRGERLVTAPDLPGYGLSPRDDQPYTPRGMTDAVLAAARWTSAQTGGQPIHAMAVSLGTEFLARAAIEAPTLFASLTLISPTGLRGSQNLRGPTGSTRLSPMARRIIRGPGWGGWLFRQLTRPSVIRYFLQRTWGSRAIDETLWAYDVQSTRAPGAEHAPLAFLSGGLFSADIHTVYEAVSVPVQVLHGTRGDFTDYRALPLPGCHSAWTIQVMEHCGAMPHFERLDEVMTAWRGLIKEAPRSV